MDISVLEVAYGSFHFRFFDIKMEISIHQSVTVSQINFAGDRWVFLFLETNRAVKI